IVRAWKQINRGSYISRFFLSFGSDSRANSASRLIGCSPVSRRATDTRETPKSAATLACVPRFSRSDLYSIAFIGNEGCFIRLRHKPVAARIALHGNRHPFERNANYPRENVHSLAVETTPYQACRGNYIIHVRIHIIGPPHHSGHALPDSRTNHPLAYSPSQAPPRYHQRCRYNWRHLRGP